ncbi:MAG: rubrivinodin family lasso peptide [Roseateles sp.]
MNEATQLEIVDLGDAKEETKGQPDLPRVEDNQVGIYKQF